MTQVRTNARKLKDVNLAQYVGHIIVEMGKSIDLFPDPRPGLGVMATELERFRLWVNKAAYGDSRAIRMRNEMRKRLENQLRELAKYVDTVANRDEKVVLASGFDLRAISSSYAGQAPKAVIMRADPQYVGSARIRIKVKSWIGARLYQFEFRRKGEKDWSAQLSTRSSIILDGLDIFTRYEFRATYIGINPNPSYSDIVSSYVV